MGALTQTGGTLFADALADIAIGTLEQTGAFGAFTQAAGTLVLDDDGSSDTSFTSEGTDTVDGQVSLVNGANWIDQGLNIGIGLAGSTVPVSASFTLEGGKAPAQVVVALAAMQVGADPTNENAGGSGSLEVDNGSAVTADALTVLNHSVISVDAKASWWSAWAPATPARSPLMAPASWPTSPPSMLRWSMTARFTSWPFRTTARPRRATC